MRSVGSLCVLGGCDLVGIYRGPPDGKSSLSTLPFASRSVRLEEPPALFGAQGNHRVDSRRATRGDEAGNE